MLGFQRGGSQAQHTYLTIRWYASSTDTAGNGGAGSFLHQSLDHFVQTGTTIYHLLIERRWTNRHCVQRCVITSIIVGIEGQPHALAAPLDGCHRDAGQASTACKDVRLQVFLSELRKNRTHILSAWRLSAWRSQQLHTVYRIMMAPVPGHFHP